MGGELAWSEIEAIYERFPALRTLKVFVETGTYLGGTTMMAAQHFAQVYTCEVVRALQQKAEEAAASADLRNISFNLEDSSRMLARVVPELDGGALFFLDAHISGSDTSYNGREYVPLLTELETVLSALRHPSLFIIDDARFWIGNQKPHDWAHVSEPIVLDLFAKHGVPVVASWLENDRYIVVTGAPSSS
jgi:hypothetical protein